MIPQLLSKVSLQIHSSLHVWFKRKEEKYVGSVPPPRLRASVADITHQQAGPHPAKSTQGRRMVLAQCIGQAVPNRLAQGINATHIGVS